MGRKKGTIADQLVLTIIFLAFCFSTVLAYTIWSNMSQPLTDALAMANGGTIAAGSALAISQTSTTLLMFDQLFIFMIFGAFLAIIISSFWMDTHPVFFVISLLSYIFSFVIYAVLGNVYFEFANASGIQAAAAQFPLMYAFWGNVPTIAMIMSVIIIIVIYARLRGKGSQRGYGA